MDQPPSPSESPPPPPASGPQITAAGDVNIAGSVAGRDVIINNYYQQVVSPGPAADDHEPPAPGPAPYKGLQYFDEADADQFFGREALTARLVGRLAQGPFLAVVGASGSGKSSLVRAGVVPALRRGQRLADGSLPPTDSARWDIRLFTPGAHPLEALAAGLADPAEPVAALTRRRDDLAADPRALALAAQQLLARTGRRRLLLVADQFEEVFTLCRQPAEREAFITALLAAVEPGGAVSVLITLRADFYAQCAQHAGLRERLAREQEYIGAMSRPELMSAILQPAARGEWKIQEGLVELFLDEAGDEPGALPLLSHALLETWARRRGRKLTLSGYTEAGGLQGAIAQTAESVFQQRLTPAQRPVARMIFLRLTEPGAAGADGPAAPDTRRRVPFSELISRASDPVTVDAVLAILTDARLVTTDTAPATRTQVVEVAHEALIREWPTLRQWLDEDRAGLLRQRQLTEAAADWQALGRDPGALYRGTRLQQALAGGFPEPLSVLEQEFLDLSRANAERETAEAGQARWLRRNRWPLALVITVALAAAGLLAFNALQSLVPRAPGRMTGAFNIAVAQFAPAEGDAAAAGQRLSQWAAEQVAADLAGRSEFQVWYDTDQLKAEQNVVIGVVASADEAAQAAARLDADVLIYGVITPQAEGFAALDLRFFVAPQQQRDLGGVGGQYVLNAPLVFNLTDPGLDAAQAVGRQASGVVRLNLGLAYEVFGRSDEALSEFLTAADYLPDSASVQFLIGQEQLFQAQRAAGAAPADLAAAQALAGQARLALEAASRMDPALMRARIALGSQGAFTVQLALLQNPIPDDCQGSQAETYRPPLLDIERAIADYQAAAGAADDAGQPLAAIAQTGLAGAYRLQAAVQCGLGDPAAARAALEQGLAAAQASLPTLEQARDHRLLAQAYHTLGTLREYQAYLNQDDAALYRQALAAYEQCIQQGALAPTDEFLQREVVGQLCQPDRDRLQGLYGGGS